jgi:hypothetical protein
MCNIRCPTDASACPALLLGRPRAQHQSFGGNHNCSPGWPPWEHFGRSRRSKCTIGEKSNSVGGRTAARSFGGAPRPALGCGEPGQEIGGPSVERLFFIGDERRARKPRPISATTYPTPSPCRPPSSVTRVKSPDASSWVQATGTTRRRLFCDVLLAGASILSGLTNQSHLSATIRASGISPLPPARSHRTERPRQSRSRPRTLWRCKSVIRGVATSLRGLLVSIV